MATKKPTNLERLEDHLYDYAIPFMAYAMRMEDENHPDFPGMYNALIGWKSKIFPQLEKTRVTTATLGLSNDYVTRMRSITKIYKFGDPSEPLRTALPPEEYIKRARREFGLEKPLLKYKAGDRVTTPEGAGVVDRCWTITTTVLYSLKTKYRLEYSVKLDAGGARDFVEDLLTSQD